MKKIINSTEEMMKLAWELIQKWYNKFLLHGDLGVGKTHFCKWIATQLWIDKNNVKSPTYTYLNIYDDKFLHIDMYRLENIEDAMAKGITEEIENYNHICIEWPKFTEYYTDENWLEVKIEKIDETTRKVKW